MFHRKFRAMAIRNFVETFAFSSYGVKSLYHGRVHARDRVRDQVVVLGRLDRQGVEARLPLFPHRPEGTQGVVTGRDVTWTRGDVDEGWDGERRGRLFVQCVCLSVFHCMFYSNEKLAEQRTKVGLGKRAGPYFFCMGGGRRQVLRHRGGVEDPARVGGGGRGDVVGVSLQRLFFFFRPQIQQQNNEGTGVG